MVTRTRIALYVIAAYQAIALTTIQFVVPVYVAGLGNAPSRLTANLMIFSLPFAGGFLLAHLVGALIDVTGRVKPFVLLALGGHLAGLAGLYLVSGAWTVLFSSALAASFTVTLNTTLKTYVTRLSEGAKGTGLSRLTLFSQFGWIIGGVLTIRLKDLSAESTHAMILADLGLTLLTLVLVSLLLPRLSSVALLSPADAERAMETVRKGRVSVLHFFRSIRDDLSEVYAEPALVRGCVAAIFLVGGNWIFISTFSLYLSRFLDATPQSIGWLNIFAACSTMAFLPGVGWICDRYGAGSSVRAGALGYVGCYLVMASFPSVFGAAVVFSVPAYAALLIGLTSAAADIGGLARRGGGIGVVDGLWAVAIALGAAAGGLVADLSLAHIPYVALCVCGIGLVLAWGAAKQIDARLDRRPAAAVD